MEKIVMCRCCADAINITFKEGKVAKTLEIAPEINLDLEKLRPPLTAQPPPFNNKKQPLEKLKK